MKYSELMAKLLKFCGGSQVLADAIIEERRQLIETVTKGLQQPPGYPRGYIITEKVR
jgi:hypothetical protein